MQPINKEAQKVFDAIMAVMGTRAYVKIDNAPNSFMALSVDRLADDRVALAHNFIQNGDVMADPDMEFVIKEGRAYPVNFTSYPTGHYSEADPSRPGLQISMKNFANTWLMNLKEQQGLADPGDLPLLAPLPASPAVTRDEPDAATLATEESADASVVEVAACQAAKIFKMRRAPKANRPASVWKHHNEKKNGAMKRA